MKFRAHFYGKSKEIMGFSRNFTRILRSFYGDLRGNTVNYLKITKNGENSENYGNFEVFGKLLKNA